MAAAVQWFDAVMDDDVEQLEALASTDASLLRTRFSGAVYDDSVKTMAEAVLGRTVGPLTPLQLACMYESEAAAAWILTRMPPGDADEPWGDGCTTLHLAAFHGMVATVAALVARGARANVRNARGFIAVDCAADDATRKCFTVGGPRSLGRSGSRMPSELKLLGDVAEEAPADGGVAKPAPVARAPSAASMVPPPVSTATKPKLSTPAPAPAPARVPLVPAPAPAPTTVPAPAPVSASATVPAAAAPGSASVTVPAATTASVPAPAATPARAAGAGPTTTTAAAAASPLGIWSPKQDAHTLDVGRAGAPRRKIEPPQPLEMATLAAAAQLQDAKLAGVGSPARTAAAAVLLVQPATASPSATPTPMLSHHNRRYAAG
jgi:hypothetical protein